MEPAKQYFSAEPSPYAEQPESFPCHNKSPEENPYHSNVSYQDPQRTYPQVFPTSAYQGYSAGHLASAVNAQQTQQRSVVMTQHGRFAPVQIDDGILPPNYMSLSLFACLCCFFPLGLFAINKSSQVDDAVRRGDLVAAKKASQSARLLAGIAIVIGSVSCLFLVIVLTGFSR